MPSCLGLESIETPDKDVTGRWANNTRSKFRILWNSLVAALQTCISMSPFFAVNSGSLQSLSEEAAVSTPESSGNFGLLTPLKSLKLQARKDQGPRAPKGPLGPRPDKLPAPDLSQRVVGDIIGSSASALRLQL